MAIHRCFIFAALLAAVTGLHGHADAMELQQLIRLNEPATLVVTGVRQDTGATVQGSGFCVDTRGLVLVTAHQSANMASLEGRLATGQRFPLEVLAIDEAREAALLKANQPLPRAAVLGDARTLERGDPLVCIASPSNLEFTVVRGIVSGRPRIYRGTPVIQTDIPASPGSSGGPVFDRFGNAVGYIILYLEQEKWVVFANPINNAYAILREHGVRIPDMSLPPDTDSTLVPVRDITERERRAIEAYNRGVAARDMKVKEEAYGIAIQLLPEFFEARFNLGVTYQSAGKPADAAEAYQEAARIRDDARVLQNLGRAYLAMERYEDAARTFEQARNLAPDAPQSHNDLGVAYRHLQRTKDAATQFRKALALDPDHAGAHYNLALLLAAEGNDGAAADHFEAYLALEPNAKDAGEVQGWIKRLRG